LDVYNAAAVPYDLCDYCSDRSANEPVQCSAGKVNAIAGANRQQKQQIAVEMEVGESSTSTSDESSDDGEMDPEPAEIAVVDSAASADVCDTVCDVKTDAVSVASSDVSYQQDLLENTAAEKTECVTERQKAVNIVVSRTAEIQVFCIHMLKMFIIEFLTF